MTNVAADSNLLLMDTLKKVATRHGLVCLLHEKPFAGVNGSGKHNNWSLSTDDGINLFKPSKKPETDTRFQLVVGCVMKAVKSMHFFFVPLLLTQEMIIVWVQMRHRQQLFLSS